MRSIVFLMLFFFTITSFAQKDEGTLDLHLGNNILHLQKVDKPIVVGLFGNLFLRTVFPVIYEIRFSEVHSFTEIAIQSERCFPTAVTILYHFPKFSLHFSVDNLLEGKEKEPSFEVEQIHPLFETAEFTLSPIAPRALKLGALFNF